MLLIGPAMINIDIIFLKKKILVIGLGVTGISVIRRMLDLGNDVIALDNNISLDTEIICSSIGVNFGDGLDIVLAEEFDIGTEVLKDINLVITSPGISSSNRLLVMAVEKGIPVWDEIELSWNLLDEVQRSNTIAVTGTNGKTTVVNLIGAALSEAGMENMVCGNVGAPLLNTFDIDQHKRKAVSDDIIRVVEVSSFQLERTYSFKPSVAILLNITSDHMDRHGSINEYTRMKMKMFDGQDGRDFAIINIDDKVTASRSGRIFGKSRGPILIKYSLDKGSGSDLWYEKNKIFYELPFSSGSIKISGTLLEGMHNISNSEAAVAAALIKGAKPGSIGKAIREFKPIEHRMEYLGEIAGIRCINDSKSTNPNSITAALRDFAKEVTIIMGGLDKDMDFMSVLPSLESSVKNIVLIGQSAARMQKLFSRFSGGFDIFTCSSLEEAVTKSFDITMAGEVLLFSPGCASMDMFKDYKDRGNRFKKAIMDPSHGS